MKKLDVDCDPFFWVLQGLCALQRKAFSLELARQQLVAPFSSERLQCALEEYGLNAEHRKTRVNKLYKESFPLLAWLTPRTVNQGKRTVPEYLLSPAQRVLIEAAHER